MFKLIKQVTFEGTCPGGHYYDNMGKKLPCPQKHLALDLGSPAIYPDMETEEYISACPRCGSKITLTPVPVEPGELVWIEDLPEEKQSKGI